MKTFESIQPFGLFKLHHDPDTLYQKVPEEKRCGKLSNALEVQHTLRYDVVWAYIDKEHPVVECV